MVDAVTEPTLTPRQWAVLKRLREAAPHDLELHGGDRSVARRLVRLGLAEVTLNGVDVLCFAATSAEPSGE